jgi:2-polyprenyl-3-methyl-5-hydroxy-6-metoxy-1,4-benzoquinol methylase
MEFSKRYREHELMDDPRLSPEKLRQTYDDIGRANRLLGGDGVTLAAINHLISKNPQKTYSIIDVGCGNGALLRKICHAFRKRNLAVALTGIDINETAITLAKEASVDYPEIAFDRVDILQKESFSQKADIVISTLTMHHLSEDRIPLFLQCLAKMTRIGIIINDLQRSRSAYYLFKLFSVIFIKTKIAKNDGLVSIRSGFTKKELLQYSTRLPDFDHEIRLKWAFRYVWLMRVKRPRRYE